LHFAFFSKQVLQIIAQKYKAARMNCNLVNDVAFDVLCSNNSQKGYICVYVL
jgi:hypothetical protein